MFREYWRGLTISHAPQGFRLTVVLEQALDQDLYEEGEAFFSSRSVTAATKTFILSQSYRCIRGAPMLSFENVPSLPALSTCLQYDAALLYP